MLRDLTMAIIFALGLWKANELVDAGLAALRRKIHGRPQP
jgi:hypothetical protein